MTGWKMKTCGNVVLVGKLHRRIEMFVHVWIMSIRMK